MTLAISVALRELALVASTTRVSTHDPVTGAWKGVRDDRLGEFSNVRRVGGGANRGGWATGGGSDVYWQAEVYAALERHPAADVDGLARAVRGLTEGHAAALGGQRYIPPGEEQPERWPGGVQVVYPTMWGFARATIFGNGEVWGREYFAAYQGPIEWRAHGLSPVLRSTFETALLRDRTLAGALRATAGLFAEVSRLCGPESSVGDLFEVGLLRTEDLPESRWQLRYDYLRPAVARQIRDATDTELTALVTRCEPLPTMEAVC